MDAQNGNGLYLAPKVCPGNGELANRWVIIKPAGIKPGLRHNVSLAGNRRKSRCSSPMVVRSQNGLIAQGHRAAGIFGREASLVEW